MRITAVEAWRVDMRLEEPYTIAYETVSEVTNVFVRVVTNRRVVGHGCAAPDEQLTGETAAGALAALTGPVATELRGSDPMRRTLLLEQLREPLRGQPSVLA